MTCFELVPRPAVAAFALLCLQSLSGCTTIPTNILLTDFHPGLNQTLTGVVVVDRATLLGVKVDLTSSAESVTIPPSVRVPGLSRTSAPFQIRTGGQQHAVVVLTATTSEGVGQIISVGSHAAGDDGLDVAGDNRGRGYVPVSILFPSAPIARGDSANDNSVDMDESADDGERHVNLFYYPVDAVEAGTDTVTTVPAGEQFSYPPFTIAVAPNAPDRILVTAIEQTQTTGKTKILPVTDP